MKTFGETTLRAGLYGLAFAFLGTDPTLAASPAYCALYAREYTAQFTTGSDADTALASEYRILEQSYYQCLNMDVEPEFPQTSVYYGEGLADILGGIGGPLSDVAQGDTSTEDVVDEAAPAPKPTTTASAETPRRKGGRGSGFEAWTPEWENWCRDHFPNSFDPADGTVKPYGEARRFCH